MSHAPEQLSMWSVEATYEEQAQPARCALAPGSPPGRDRKAYLDECAMRWDGPALMDARRNWRIFEEAHDALVAILVPYLRDNWIKDISGKCHNPDGTLTAWLWKCSADQENWWIWDFCEHYQKCHLRRGLIAYAKQVIRELQANNGSEPTARTDARTRP